MKNKTKYPDLFEKSGDAILIIQNGKFVDCNKSTVSMLRYNNKADFLRTHPSELSPKKQPDGKLSFVKANEMIKTAFKNGNHRFEWIHTKSDGENFPVEVLLTSIFDGENNQILYTVWRDITRRKQAEQELTEHRDHLEELVEKRTLELERKNTELERLNKLFINREYRIRELRDELKKYEK